MQRLLSFVGVATLALVAAGVMATVTTADPTHDKSLLYLVEFEANDAGAPSTREQTIELLGQQIVPSLNGLAENRKVRAGGLFVGARAGVFIVSARSHDEVTELVRELPAWGVWGWKVTPLESFSHRAELEKKAVEQLQADPH